jgi:hypothetical protein
MAAVLKTVVRLVRTGGSNPSRSAFTSRNLIYGEVPEWSNGSAC